jgi:hypothetical protein
MPEIVELSQEIVVRIGSRAVEGWVDRESCPTCGTSSVYCVAFDAVFCWRCNLWLAVRCDEPGCPTCACRPERPLALEH